MKFAAIAVMTVLVATPAFAQGYGGGDTTNNPSAANPSAAVPASPSANSSDDTRVASNQTKHTKHKKSSTSSQDQMSTSPANSGAASPDASPSQSAPAPQQ